MKAFGHPGWMKGWIAIVLLTAAAACGGAAETGPPANPSPGAPPAESLPPAPWNAAPVAPGSVSGLYMDAWRAAENRSECALIALTDVRSDATPRQATFAGGWGIAYDLPNQRSAFGIAGTGTSPTPDTYDEWPHYRQWADGSAVGYGPEGGSGPNQLGYLTIWNENCLYNVWSRLGIEHLESLFPTIRRVRTS